MPHLISIVEDNSQTRLSLVLLINGTEDLCCVGEYPDAETALSQIPANPTELVLMDMQLPKLSGIECLKRLKDLQPTLKIVMLTVYEDADAIFNALRAGADGYLLKGKPVLELLNGIRSIFQGGTPISSEVASRIIQWFHQKGKQKELLKLEELTLRETEILNCLCQGFTYKDIAESLGITVHTTNSHIKKIYEKLHVHSRIEAMAKFKRGS